MEMVQTPGVEETILRRLKWTAAGVAAAGAVGAELLRGSAAAVSLALAAAIVILSFFVLERVTASLITPRIGLRARDFLLPFFLAIVVIPLLLALLNWRKFDIFAGLFGFSVVIVAIAIEFGRGLGRR
jgi:hypothetical protein